MDERNLILKIEPTHKVSIYMSGPIETAKQVIREYCMQVGLCVTIEPTTFIYTGGEEQGFVIGLLQYPRFPKDTKEIDEAAKQLALKILDATFQWSALVVTPQDTLWINTRPQTQAG